MPPSGSANCLDETGRVASPFNGLVDKPAETQTPLVDKAPELQSLPLLALIAYHTDHVPDLDEDKG